MHRDLKDVITEIDQLAHQQTTLENRRHEALAETSTAHREADLAQDLMHTSLQRIAELDDDVYHARAIAAAKSKTLDSMKTLIMSVVFFQFPKTILRRCCRSGKD